MTIPTAKTWYSCRVMRPDFKIRSTVTGLLMATWTEPGEPGPSLMLDADRMVLIGACYDFFVARERERS